MMPSLHSLLDVADIVLDGYATSKHELFELLGRHMERVHGQQADAVTSALQRREMAGSTALGQRLAIPHARVKGLDRIRMVYLHLGTPLPFDAPDDLPVTDVICLMVPSPATQEHLDLLAEVASLFSDADFRDRLHASASPEAVKELLEDWSV